ncbi:TetR/AcrR family transcriptional regulator [Desulfotignum phosphitoxidans]|jgi:AcrR family transcriptional regulator|uniref:Regulatory protein TetR n=1 Tax=Desulfotignum phosphitoxidans DSM 13687 TaxID=1286635 RepID=S0FZN9_9BACT|nr:TetR/AcrR family transcriptional regulator [Desulfotignum phosphitoxidans]EMS77442.1 regulatory protein TetR [Desulfotignum phosphitoxidans DSM 13687]
MMEKKKLSRREMDKLRHRRQMLAAALDLFSLKGYHNVSMHEIAGKAEFAIGTLYKFFKNKEDLYKALIMEKADEYHRALSDVLSKENDTLAVIGDYIAAKAQIFANSVAALRLYFAETRGASFNIKAGLDQDIRKLYDEMVEQLVSTMKRGIDRKVLKEGDPYYMAVALEGLTNSFLFCWLEDPKHHSYEENVQMIKEMFLNGCLAK